MSKIKVGSVVKFTDSEGRLDGGTVVDFLRKDNQDCLLINSLEGRKIVKNRNDVSLIQRQQRGKVPASFLSDLKKECDKVNIQAGLDTIPYEEKVQEPAIVKSTQNQVKQKDGGVSSEAKEVPPYVSSYLDNKLKKLKEENNNLSHQIALKDEEIDRLNSEINSLRNREEKSINSVNENLVFTVKTLGDALLISSLQKEGEVVSELLKIINKLNNIE